jgi:hypothetical protein
VGPHPDSRRMSESLDALVVGGSGIDYKIQRTNCRQPVTVSQATCSCVMRVAQAWTRRLPRPGALCAPPLCGSPRRRVQSSRVEPHNGPKQMIAADTCQLDRGCRTISNTP